jgi:hypothetical protein
MRNSALAIFAATTLAAGLVHAQEWYAGFGAGQGTIDGYRLPVQSSAEQNGGVLTSFSFSPLVGHDTMLTARLGARLHRNLAIEAGYFRFGDYTFDSAPINGGVQPFTASARSGGVALVGLVPVGQLDLYARGGYARTEIKSEAGLVTARERFNEAYYGGGARWNITREAGLFVEYQRHQKLELDGFFAGFDWRF